MSYEVNSIHKILCAELEQYIKAQYFGKSELLLKALSNQLAREGVMYRKPYVEPLYAYKISPDGFTSIALPEWLRKFFVRLGQAGLGVYLSPFVHQMQALKTAVDGKDLFVSTGTGSGKTECFMWPLLAKLTTEAHNSPSTWKQRGVRVMIMYPMNALVADQICRLRRSIGDRDQKFVEIFREVCGQNARRPQFGMYTGRTPYPGSKPDAKQDRALKRTLSSIAPPDDEEEKKFWDRMARDGKIPAKIDMKNFLERLERSDHTPDDEDAELITRFEMQKRCPDILITNYSMLEYMLMRPREEKIWSDTGAWLDADPSNKLLFVIDEAHMYKGSAGGEVALLIRRLMYRLGITRNRVQFILTTASMPDNRDAVDKFFKDLTASDFAPKPLKGERDKSVENVPVRMHMLFRGINGVYACANPKCPQHHVEENAYGKLTLGEIFLSGGNVRCDRCGGAVYELYNDRRCGALFFKGYVFEDELQAQHKTYLWRDSGQVLDSRLKEIHLFIPPEGYELDNNRRKKIKPCYLDVRSGFLYFDAAREEQDGFRKLYYSLHTTKGRPDVLTFASCPYCQSTIRHRQLTSFSTRGNQSFFNLIKAQFQNQPAVPEKCGDPEHIPNEGRKVLLFSDSRQRAAILARDMSKIADDTAARQLFALASARMEQSGKKLSLNALYGYFCLDAGLQNVRLFNGDDRGNFYADCANIKDDFDAGDDEPEKNLSDAPDRMKEVVLRMFCGGYNTLYDFAAAWLEPSDKSLRRAMRTLEKGGVKISAEEFVEIFNAWITDACDKYMALGNNFSDDVRKSVGIFPDKYGLPSDWDFSSTFYKILGWTTDSNSSRILRVALTENFLKQSNGNYFIDLDGVKVRFDFEHQWHRCEKCREFTPYLLKDKCPSCGNEATHVLNAHDVEALKFWRKPLVEALNGTPIRVIDTEEHTAQLSHKDQRDELLSKTEEYELRFQDYPMKKQLPVDILSSTTTMEVGIDIGSLVAVGLRNIPPMRENYQQRAGRAGRRGASLSTIVTFCDGGPHDLMYFKNPVPMFEGEPRKPWIDVESEKLIRRHLTMIIFQEFLSKRNTSLDDIPAAAFLDSRLDDFKAFAIDWNIPRGTDLIPKNYFVDMKFLIEELFAALDDLQSKKEMHPDMFDETYKMLDALYDVGVIPSYSFPKNVVSTYITNADGKTVPIGRGLEIAISECAPGRAIVVDKQTYQIGGIYAPDNSWSSNPARKFFNDPHYLKELSTCEHCGWFGLREESRRRCPFCGSEELSHDKKMLVPWGFAPKNAAPIAEAQLDEEYSTAQPPEYSTLPENDDIAPIASCKNIRMASRDNQRIIMLKTAASLCVAIAGRRCPTRATSR